MENNIIRYIGEGKMYETQKSLGNAVGIKREYINKIANAKVTPTVGLAIRIARALNVSVEDLWGEYI